MAMANSTITPMIDRDKLVKGVEDVLAKTRPTDYAPPSVRSALADEIPGYVSHNTDASPAGKLAGKAAIDEVEAAALKIESLGEELRKRTEELLKFVQDTANEYRLTGTELFNRIEAHSAFSKSVMDHAEKVRQGPPPKKEAEKDIYETQGGGSGGASSKETPNAG